MNSKVKVSARRKKAYAMAVEAGGVAIAELSGQDNWILVRDHLILSATPSNTPQKKRRRSQNDEKGGAGWDDTDEAEDGDSVGSSACSEDSDSEEKLTPRRGSSRVPKKGRGPLWDVGSESEGEDARTQRASKRVRLAPAVDFHAITPASMDPCEAVNMFFKPKPIQEASSFTIPEDVNDIEEQEAYLERAGRALARLKETHGSSLLRDARPRDAKKLRIIYT